MSSNSKSSFGSGALYTIGTALFVTCIVVTFVYLGKATSSASNAQEIDSAITTIAYTNGGLIALMMILAYSYVRSYPDTRDNYVFLMTHVAVFLSLLGVSIAVITKRG
jgi:hypothetical protein